MTDVLPVADDAATGGAGQQTGSSIPADQTDPSVNDVLAQQMGTEYNQVETQDKQQLQKDLQDQGTAQADESAAAVQSVSEVPDYREGVDDRNTSDG